MPLDGERGRGGRALLRVPAARLDHGPGDAPAQDKLNFAVSISVATPDQAETDRLWDALTEGGNEIACGWLRDRYGLCWQIVPARFAELLSSPDKAAVERAIASWRR